MRQIARIIFLTVGQNNFGNKIPCLKKMFHTAYYVYYDYEKECYSHHSITKRTGSIKRPSLDFFKKSLLNNQYDIKNKALSS